MLPVLVFTDDISYTNSQVLIPSKADDMSLTYIQAKNALSSTTGTTIKRKAAGSRSKKGGGGEGGAGSEKILIDNSLAGLVGTLPGLLELENSLSAPSSPTSTRKKKPPPEKKRCEHGRVKYVCKVSSYMW